MTTVLDIVEKLAQSCNRAINTKDKSAFKGTLTWAKKEAKKLDKKLGAGEVPEDSFQEPEPEEEPAGLSHIVLVEEDYEEVEEE